MRFKKLILRKEINDYRGIALSILTITRKYKCSPLM